MPLPTLYLTPRIAVTSTAPLVRSASTTPRATWHLRLLTLLAVMGPCLIVMVGDNDAGGVATYAQAGQNYGPSLLWLLLLLIPVLIVNQEMVVRLGLVTGVGHARLIIERSAGSGARSRSATCSCSTF
jgi:Mn2+/Fe2+ NRAMP family transporter